MLPGRARLRGSGQRGAAPNHPAQAAPVLSPAVPPDPGTLLLVPGRSEPLDARPRERHASVASFRLLAPGRARISIADSGDPPGSRLRGEKRQSLAVSAVS